MISVAAFLRLLDLVLRALASFDRLRMRASESRLVRRSPEGEGGRMGDARKTDKTNPTEKSRSSSPRTLLPARISAEPRAFRQKKANSRDVHCDPDFGRTNPLRVFAALAAVKTGLDGCGRWLRCGIFSCWDAVSASRGGRGVVSRARAGWLAEVLDDRSLWGGAWIAGRSEDRGCPRAQRPVAWRACAGETIEKASARSRSWSKGVLWEAANVDEMAVATTRTDARRGIGGSILMAGIEVGGRGGLCRSRRKRLGWGRAIELQEEAGLSGEMAFGRCQRPK